VTSAAALAGTRGLQVSITDTTARYLTENEPKAESRYRARFYFDPNAITMANNDLHVIFNGYNAGGSNVVRVDFRRSSSTYQVRASIRDDASTWADTSWVTISDAPHYLEFDWQAATAAGANNGSLTFWVDGTQQGSLTGIDNDTRRVDYGRIGAISGLDVGTTGTYYFDAFESRRSTYIGAGTALPDEIFANGFENGNLTYWSSTSGGGLSVTGAASLAPGGTLGMQVVITNTTGRYVQDNTPNGEKRYRARFYFDPNSITMANGNLHTLFLAYYGSGNQVIQVEFQRTSGVYQLRAGLRNDASVWTNTGWVTISDAPHAVEFDWQAATAAGANNGSLTFWIDGAQQAALTGVDNDTYKVDHVRLGSVAGLDSGTSGTYYFDAFESRRSSYIGAGTSSTTAITYSYDPLYRLTTASYSTGQFFSYTYDAVGNRLTQTTLNGTTVYTYDAASRLINVSGTPHTWDANGNLLSDGVFTYTYDTANRLVTLKQGTSVTYTYGYTGLSDRMRQVTNGVTTTYALDLNTGLTQVLADGTNTYLYGNARIAQQSTTMTHYFQGDALGSVRLLTNQNGAVTLARSYEPYGNVLNSISRSRKHKT
jgi:YD repeat-containing protein